MATETATHEPASSGNPVVAALLSMFIPGLGHYYAGKKGRGLYWFVGTAAYVFVSLILVFVGVGILLLIAEPVIHLLAGVDAYVQSS